MEPSLPTGEIRERLEARKEEEDEGVDERDQNQSSTDEDEAEYDADNADTAVSREHHKSGGHIVDDVREVFDDLRRGVMESTAEMMDAVDRGRKKVYHAIAANNVIVQFSIGANDKLILNRTIKSFELRRKKLSEARQALVRSGQQKLREKITGDRNKRIRDHMKEVPQVKLMDKVSFTMGVLVIVLTEFLIMRHPEWFIPYFTAFMLSLFVIRYVMYSRDKYQFFMLDFCYLINISCMAQALFFPDNLTWFHANFTLSFGPLCVAVLLWHNSLVFHSIDKLTSFFLHVFPPMLEHLIRWQLIETPAIKSWDQGASFVELFLPSMGMYVVWQIAYLFITEVYYSEMLDSDPEIVTSLRYLSQDKKNPLTKLVTKAVRRVGLLGPEEPLDPSKPMTKGIFVSVQFVYTLLLLLPPYFLYHWYEGCVMYMAFVFVIGTWNGASYYIEIFSKRYNLKFSASAAPSEVDKAEHDREVDMESVESQEDDDENDEFVEAVEDMADLNASQRKELMEILRKVENEKSEDKDAARTDCSTRERNQPNNEELNGDVIEANISS